MVKSFDLNQRRCPAKHFVKRGLTGMAVFGMLLAANLQAKASSETVQIQSTNSSEIEQLATQQSKQVKGQVTDKSGAPLPGVTVVLKGTTKGVITDFDGNFSVSVEGDAPVLIFSFIGMVTQEVPVDGRSAIPVVLETETFNVDEVVVVGYGQQAKESVTAAISTVAAKELVQSPTANISNSLAGRLSGLTSIQVSGKPGDDASELAPGELNQARIEHERMVELAFEDHRFWDVRRWKKGSDYFAKPVHRLVLTNTETGMNYEVKKLEDRVYTEKMNWYPIPQSEIVKTGWTQNSGW